VRLEHRPAGDVQAGELEAEHPGADRVLRRQDELLVQADRERGEAADVEGELRNLPRLRFTSGDA
jgi:hypothetical protein